jgi:hypothetical protein
MLGPNWTAGVKLAGGDANLGVKTEFAPVSELGRCILQDDVGRGGPRNVGGMRRQLQLGDTHRQMSTAVEELKSFELRANGERI